MLINIGVPSTSRSMLSEWICRIKGTHEWSPEDFNEFTMDMDIGDEAVLRCKRCNIKIVTIEKRRDDLKWTPHVKEAVIYEVNPEYTKQHGQKYDLDKFREDNK